MCMYIVYVYAYVYAYKFVNILHQTMDKDVWGICVLRELCNVSIIHYIDSMQVILMFLYKIIKEQGLFLNNVGDVR